MDGFEFCILYYTILLAVVNDHDFNNGYYNVCVLHLRRKYVLSFFCFQKKSTNWSF